VLSEKTVSVHVSNMLRKTGATGRVELAQRASTYRSEPERPKPEGSRPDN
jgi:DNA-binding NarL/FixJ family response regulator